MSCTLLKEQKRASTIRLSKKLAIANLVESSTQTGTV